NVPVFTKDAYTVTLNENAPVGTTVVKVNATDLDEGKNGEVVYALGNNVKNNLRRLFEVNEITGEIILRDHIPFKLMPSSQVNIYSLVTSGLLDRETKFQYHITLSAKDLGQPSLSSVKTITVLISDVNDNTPEFSFSPYAFYVMENNVPGKFLFSVSATDKDANENAIVSYQIWRESSEEKYTSFININSENGAIYALKSFDFETVKKFKFQVVATDSGAPSLSSNVTVNVWSCNLMADLF
uniref:Cadherin domain-containing protein n=1 Tax=Sinocyclocheilus rhinocerous TaxID=307959 RepID=A0A673L0A5_9TELE